MTTQRPSKPIKARAMGVGITEKVWQALEGAGLVIVDKAKLDKLLSAEERRQQQRREVQETVKQAVEELNHDSKGQR